MRRSLMIFGLAALSAQVLSVAVAAVEVARVDHLGRIVDILASPWMPAKSHAAELSHPQIKKYLWCHPNWATPPPLNSAIPALFSFAFSE